MKQILSERRLVWVMYFALLIGFTLLVVVSGWLDLADLSSPGQEP